MKIERIWEMPNRYTFKMRSVSTLLRSVMNGGPWADPFSGLHSPAQIRNDADDTNPAEYHMDGLEFLKSLGDKSLAGVFFDPPYSTEQALRKYRPKQNGTAGRAEYWARCKDEIARIVRPGGMAICFGWDSIGIGKKRGFELEQVLLICHGACHNDTIITVEREVLNCNDGDHTSQATRKPWKNKIPVEVVLGQINRLRDDAIAKEEELKQAKRQLQKLEEAKKVLEAN